MQGGPLYAAVDAYKAFDTTAGIDESQTGAGGRAGRILTEVKP